MGKRKITSWKHPEDSQVNFELWGPYPLKRGEMKLARVRCWDNEAEDYYSPKDTDPDYISFFSEIPSPPTQGQSLKIWHFCGWENDGQYALYGSKESAEKIASENRALTKR